MSKYYDEKCVECDLGCHHYGEGKFPNGSPYICCRCYGYILHLEKGISKEHCDGFITEENWQKKEMQKEKIENRKREKTK